MRLVIKRKKRISIQKYYCCNLSFGEITSLTLEDCMRDVDRYLKRETPDCDLYVIEDSDAVIFECSMQSYKRTVVAKRERFEEQFNSASETTPNIIDYGILGYFSDWVLEKTKEE